MAGFSDFCPPSLALALPPLIWLGNRRMAAVVALAAAAWFWSCCSAPLAAWIGGLEASYCLALLVQVIAGAGSPRLRRAAAVRTWRTWLVLCAAGIAMGPTSIRSPRALPAWQAAGLVVAFLAAVGAALVISLPKPAAFRLLLLVAMHRAVRGLGLACF